MNKRWSILAPVSLFMVILSVGGAKAQPPFLDETLTAEVTFLSIPVATATFRVTEETVEGCQPNYHLAIWAKSTPFYSIFYPVDNRYDAFFTWPEVHTVRYKRCIREPGVDRQCEVRYHDGLAFYDEEDPIPVPPGVRDLFSALYALRVQRLEKDRLIDSPLDLDGQLWVVRAEVLNREQVRTPRGSQWAIKVLVRFLGPEQNQQPRRESDILTNNLVLEGTKLTIWFSDDERKLPLRAQYRLAPFSIKAVFSLME